MIIINSYMYELLRHTKGVAKHTKLVCTESLRLQLLIIIIIITVQTSIMSMMYKVIYLFILTNKFLNSSIVFTVDKLSGTV